MAAEKQSNTKGDKKDKNIREKNYKWGHGGSWIYIIFYNEVSERVVYI